MTDRLRFWVFWPVALLLWHTEKGARWLGNLFEDFATKDYKRAREHAAPSHRSGTDS